MARKSTLRRTQELSSQPYKFIWVQWSDSQLVALRSFVSNHPSSDLMHVQALSDLSWKVSISTNQRSGKYLIALSDKGGRPGCKGKTFAVEHTDLLSALSAGYYFAIEVIGDTGYLDDGEVAPDLF